jgi:hypothetical protein
LRLVEQTSMISLICRRWRTVIAKPRSVAFKLAIQRPMVPTGMMLVPSQLHPESFVLIDRQIGRPDQRWS